MTADEWRVHETMFRTLDPTVLLNDKPVPALTTLLHRVCDNDPARFPEACRVVELFVREALTSGAKDG